jgi:hypothetical protein
MITVSVETAHLRHLEVADDHVVARTLELVGRAHAVFGGAHDVAFHAEEVGNDVTDEFLVIDDEHPRAVFGVTRVVLGHPGWVLFDGAQSSQSTPSIVPLAPSVIGGR